MTKQNHMVTPRKRGRAGCKDRKRRRQRHPLCVICLESGKVKPTEHIDHIIPLSQGGPDTDENCQGLCATHHAIKSAGDTGHQLYPTFIKTPKMPVTVICGPPASGKTTYAKARSTCRDLIIDLDDIIERQTGQRYNQDKACIGPAIRERNAILAGLWRRDGVDKVWFIISAPQASQRRWWAKTLSAELVVLDPGYEVCIRRCKERGTPWLTKAIREWYHPKQWTPPPKRVSYGLDGYPIEG